MSTGRLIDIAHRQARRMPMLVRGDGTITQQAGLAGDYKGARHPRRQITVLAREAWEMALAELVPADLFPESTPDLPWTARRANLLVEGTELPRASGGILRIGPVRLEITGQTYPCSRMEEAHTGLLSALAKDWRGGVTCRVLEGGRVALGDAVEVLLRPPEVVRRLPG
jgi:MOSC domain-containing protein YiiM